MLSDPKFWVAVSFVLFVIVAWNPLIMRLAKALDARGEKIRAEIEEARRLRAEAEAMLKRAEAARSEAEAEAAALLMHAKDEAVRIGEQARADLDAALKRRERMALDRIAAAEASAVADVRNAAAEVAGAAARTVLAATLDTKADAALVEQSLGDLPKALRAA